MFKFNFQVETSENDMPGTLKEKSAEETAKYLNFPLDCNEYKDSVFETRSPSPQPIEWYNAEKVEPDKKHFEILDVYHTSSTTANYGNFEISYLLTDCLKEVLKETADDIVKAEENHSDLIPGVYEGGAKIWECTEDLLQYLANNLSKDSLRSKRVLDLGCGAGLLGLYAIKNQATVEFQDYNKDVVQNITIPNVLINLPDPKDIREISFYSGDWANYAEETSNYEKFDCIFTSETIYNAANYQKLIDCFKAKLKTGGVVYLAAKVYYFGVGGGICDFTEYLEKDEIFVFKVVSQSTSDVHREILEIRFKDYCNS